VFTPITLGPTGPGKKEQPKAGDTIVDALNYGGGDTDLGAERNLLRAASAAYINALKFGSGIGNYPYSSAQVVSMTNAVLALFGTPGFRASAIALAGQFDTANNFNCPLN